VQLTIELHAEQQLVEFNRETDKYDDEKFLQANASHVKMQTVVDLLLRGIFPRHTSTDKLNYKRDDIEKNEKRGQR
jgi:hypothetical protein